MEWSQFSVSKASLEPAFGGLGSKDYTPSHTRLPVLHVKQALSVIHAKVFSPG